jgi:hypothetical protein
MTMTPEETQALGKALDTAKDYADTVLKGPLAEFGGILSDTIGYWRLRNRVRLMLKAKHWLEERGVEPRKLLPEVFVPLLEDGGNVEDQTLADLFASLLASHLDPNKKENVHPSYTKVLAQLSPLDAQLMLVYREFVSYQGAREVGLRGPALTVEVVAKQIGASKRAAYLSCLNLDRLGIIEHQGYLPPADHLIPTIFEDSPNHQQYRATEYGIAFCDACHYRKEDGKASVA